MAVYNQLWIDHYDDAVVRWSYSIPQASTTIQQAPYSSALIFTIQSGVNNDWWDLSGDPGGPNAPIAYYSIPRSNIIRPSCSLTDLTTTGGTEGNAGLALWTDRDNAWWWTYAAESSRVILDKIVGGTAAFVAQSAVISAPTTSAPLYLRINFNRPAGTLDFEYSTDSGSNWTTTSSQATTFTPSYVGLWAKNYAAASLPAVSASFDFLRLEHVPFTQQYRPLSTRETSHNDALTVRALRDLASAVDNAKAYALNQKRWMYAWPGISKLSTAAGTGEKVMHVFCPRTCGDGRGLLAVTAGHERFAGSGSTTWKLYCLRSPYRGSSTLDSSWLDSDYTTTSWTTSSATHAIARSETQGVIRDGYGQSWLLLTASNSDGTTQSRLTTLDVTPVLGISDSTVGLL